MPWKGAAYWLGLVLIAHSACCLVTLSLLGSNIILMKAITGIIFILRPLIQNIYVRKKFNIDLKSCNQNLELKNKWDGLAQHIASVVHGNVDITLLTIFGNLTEVSIYSVYYLVVKGVKSLITSFSIGIDATFGDMIAKKEMDNLNNKFNLYEVGYFTICTIVFTCTLVLIVPFISVYTKEITDANYIRYTFGYLIVLSEYIWAIRSPYISLAYAAGHFKETKIGAWIECSINIFMSIILINKFGIIGVAVGTLIAMTIRTVEFIYHANIHILNRKLLINIKKIILLIVESLLIFALCNLLPLLNNVSYFNWIFNALMVLCISSIVTLTLNFTFYNKEMKEFFKLILRRSKK